jgi:CCR4-NOT transcription complex subunit 2
MHNPSGEILAMLGKGQSTPGKLPGGEDLPSFGMDDFPALGGGLNNLSLQGGRQGSDTIGPMASGMSSIAAAAAAKLSQDFQMASEDFPALPGLGAMGAATRSEDGMEKGDGMGGMQQQPGGHFMQGVAGAQGGPVSLPQGGLGAGVVRRPGFEGSSGAPKGGVPSPAAGDRFGLSGLLNVIQMTNPDLNTLALGTDLTTLGLNLNSNESLYSTFASPWADGPSRREPEFSLPMCYYMQPPTLKTGHIQKFQLETLFYIYYMLPKDTLQAVAASELYTRDWKFHRDLKMWFHKQPSLGGTQSRANTHIYFDVNVWERRTYFDANKNLEQGFLTEEDVRIN